MTLDPVRDLGKRLAGNERMERQLAENITPDDPSEQIVLGATSTIRVQLKEFRVVKKVPDSGALVFDRPLEGQMFDNSSKSFDVGYDGALEEVLYQDPPAEPLPPPPGGYGYMSTSV